MVGNPRRLITTTTTLELRQIEGLEALAASRHTSKADLIREGVDLLLAREARTREGQEKKP